MELRYYALFLCCRCHIAVQGFSVQRQQRLVALGSSARTDDENDFVPITRKRREPKPYYEQEDAEYFSDRRGEGHESNYYGEEEKFDEDNEYDDVMEYLDDVLENWDPTEHPMFGNEVVPNALLDSMDPDGAADRFPELARDGRFWFEMLLFVAFLDFLSLAGPQDAIPALPSF